MFLSVYLSSLAGASYRCFCSRMVRPRESARCGAGRARHLSLRRGSEGDPVLSTARRERRVPLFTPQLLKIRGKHVRRHQTCHFRKRATSAPAKGPAHKLRIVQPIYVHLSMDLGIAKSTQESRICSGQSLCNQFERELELNLQFLSSRVGVFDKGFLS